MKRHTIRLLIVVAPVAIACSASAQVLPKNKTVVTEVPPAAVVTPPAVVAPAAPAPAPTVVAPASTVTTPAPAVTITAPPAVAVPVAQPLQVTRAADLGLWFSGMANDGLTISDLADTSIFTNAGFRVSDRILSINGQPIRTEAQFVEYMTSPTLGTPPVQVLIVRNGQEHLLTLSPAVINQGIVAHDPLYRYGLVIDDANPNQIVVQRVYPRTPAYYAGLRQGDVITTFGGQRVTSLSAFRQGLAQANVAVPVQITRSGQLRDIRLEPVVNQSVHTALRPTIEPTVTPAHAPVIESAVVRPHVGVAPTPVGTAPTPSPVRGSPPIALPATPVTPTVVPTPVVP